MINKIKHTRCGNELLLLFAVFCSTANAENFTSTFPNTNTSALYDGNNSTEVTKEDLENGVKDERGVLYSKDGKRLLKAPADLREYRVKDRTTVICDNAFKMEVGFGSNSELRKVVIPPSVTTIGNSVFTSCKNLRTLRLSPYIKASDDPWESKSVSYDFIYENWIQIENIIFDETLKNSKYAFGLIA